MGAGDYTKINKKESAIIGLPGQPVAALTKLGWVGISPGKLPINCLSVFDHFVRLALKGLKTTTSDFEYLCSLDVLGTDENHKKGNIVLYEEI